MPAIHSYGIVIGAGAGEEAALLWSRFPGRVLLVDIGKELAENCRRQHPTAEVCCSSAEDMMAVHSASFDFYCALRSYQSIHFDATAAIAEARRVLRPGGLAVISISDAYLTVMGTLQRGQIIDDCIDLSASLRLTCMVADLLNAAGFRGIDFYSFETELVVSGWLQ